MIDLNGDIVVRGRMSWPPDDAGFFQGSGCEWFRIGRGRFVVGCDTRRHSSGFLETRDIGPMVGLPPSFGPAVDHALRFGVKQPVEVETACQNGALSDLSKSISQPLANARLRIDEHVGAVRIEVSARLHGTYFESWNKGAANYWRDDQATLNLSYMVDPLTRVLAFGAYIPEAFGERGTGVVEMPPQDRFPDLNIDNALVGPLVVFGRDGADWISFHESTGPGFAGISITKHGPPSRNPAGFLEDIGSYRWPRVSLRGIDMDMVVSLLRGGKSLDVVLKGDGVGDLSYGRADEDIPLDQRRISEAEIHVVLAPAGLKWRYAAVSGAGKREGEFILPWETVILRFPAFARYRERALDRPIVAP